MANPRREQFSVAAYTDVVHSLHWGLAAKFEEAFCSSLKKRSDAQWYGKRTLPIAYTFVEATT
jgi:hypothetical protein